PSDCGRDDKCDGCAKYVDAIEKAGSCEKPASAPSLSRLLNGRGLLFLNRPPRSPCPRDPRQHTFQEGRDPVELPRPDEHVPKRLEFLPAGSVEEVFNLVLQRAVMQRSPGDRWPSIKLAIRPVVPGLERRRRKVCRPVDDVPCVIKIPVVCQ